MDLSAYKQVAAVEKHHWYFVARRRIIAKVLSAFVTTKKTNRVLDIGIGTGAMVDILQPYGSVIGIEYISEGLKYTRQNVDQSVELLQASGDMLPFQDKSFDLVTTFDVLEHIPNDQAAMSEIWRVLNQHGIFCGVVPAHPWLWSEFDTFSHHQRRYTKAQLQTIVKQAGFIIRSCFYTHSSILMPVIMVRRLRQILTRLLRGQRVFGGELTLPPLLVNICLTYLASFEARILPYHPLPFGVSLVIFATKD